MGGGGGGGVGGGTGGRAIVSSNPHHHPPSPWPDGDAAEVAAGCAASLGDKRREAEPKEVGEANKWTGAVEKCD